MLRSRRCSGQTLLLLRCLIDRPRQWRHGYDLSKATELKSGTLYPILVRLSERGLLEAKWQPAAQPGRPPRHMYRLTAKGVAYAKQEIDACASLRSLTVRTSRA